MKKEGYIFLGIVVAILAALIIWALYPFVESARLKAGFSLAIGWQWGKGLFQPIGKRLKRFIDLLINTAVWRYYQWKEKH